MHVHLFYFKSSYILANASSFLLVTELWPLVVVESHASLRSELYWPLVLPNTPKPKFCGFSCGLLNFFLPLNSSAPFL